MYEVLRRAMSSSSIYGYFLQALPITIIIGSLYILLRMIYLRKQKRQIAWGRETIRLLFVCYLIGLCSLVILPANFWLRVYDAIFFGGWENIGPLFRKGSISLTPILVLYLSGNSDLSVWDIEMLIGNIVMFIPFGLFLSLIVKKLNRQKAIIVAVLIPFVVELLQLVLGRSFDIDDLICNFLGIVVGFFIAFRIKMSKASYAGD